MSRDPFYILTKPCRRVPTRRCFALRASIDALMSVHDADVCPNDSGIDDLNEVLQLPISQSDRTGRNTPHQIPIACALI
jgi:hypothetical protein